MERIQKILAQAGIASRRRAEEMILAGRVRVNGQVINELGAQADPENDAILVDNHPVAIESKAYYVLNKPRGYISDRDDTADNKTALDLVPDGRRLFAAGRLDLMSEGLLFLTNDGELANRLTHPRYEHEKEYLALVFGVPDDKVMERLVKGIMFDGEWMKADSAARAGRSQEFGEAGRDETWLRIVLHEGKKRQIRHMCASLGHPVKRLIRVRIGPLRLGTLKVGEWRKLTRDEVTLLKQTQERSKRGGSISETRGEPGATEAGPKPRVSRKGWAKNKIKGGGKRPNKSATRRDERKRFDEPAQSNAERPASRPPRPRPGWAESGGRGQGRGRPAPPRGRDDSKGRKEGTTTESTRTANTSTNTRQKWEKIGGRDEARKEQGGSKSGGRLSRNRGSFGQDAAPAETRGGRAPFKPNAGRGGQKSNSKSKRRE